MKTMHCLIIAALLLGACHQSALFDDVQSFDDKGWAADAPLEYTIPITDTTRAYDILLHIRNKKTYAYSNLWLFIETAAPNGLTHTDTLEIMLADPAGRWRGHGVGNVNAMLVPYARGVRFTMRGIYSVTVTQGMREEYLNDILDVGLRVVPHQE